MENKNGALVEVIIPVYNGEKYLREAVNSVLNQPCKDVAVLLINDGSKDNSLQIARDIAAENNRVRVIDQENCGVAATRNRGIELSMAKYVAFLDQDDFWVPHVFDEELAATLRTCSEDMVSFAYYESNQHATRLRIFESASGHISNAKEHGHLAFRHHSSFLIKRDFLVDHTILTDRFRNEDFRFIIRCFAKASEILQRKEAIFVYRNNELSVTHTGLNVDKVFNSCYEGYTYLYNESEDNFLKKIASDMKLRILLEYSQYMAKSGKTGREIHSIIHSMGLEQLYNQRGWMSEEDKCEWNRLLNEPKKFCRYHRLQQRKNNFSHTLMRIKPIKTVFEKKKYPIINRLDEQL